MKRTDLQAIARAKRDDAVFLLENGRFSNAYYLAGYATEIALKACVTRQFSADTLPEKAFVNAIYTHVLSELVSLAGLKAELQEQEKRDATFAGNWALVAQWTEGTRYQTIDAYTATITVDALIQPASGVFPWIELHW